MSLIPLDMFSDAKYKWDLMMYNMGLTSHPPIVESKTATPKLKEEIQQLNDKYTVKAAIDNSLTSTFSAIPNFISSNIQVIAIILALVLIGFMLFKKEMRLT